MIKQAMLLSLLLLCAQPAGAQEGGAPSPAFGDVTDGLGRQLQEAVGELDALQQRIAEEKIPLSRELSRLHQELETLKAEYKEASRLVDSSALDLAKMGGRIEKRKDDAAYLANLFGEFVRDFEIRTHISEQSRYEAVLDAAKLAAENSSLSQREVFETQAALLGTALDRLHELAGGATFEGSALDANGLVKDGRFVLVGPTAVFRADDGSHVGIVEQRVNSQEPTVIAFADPEDAAAAGLLVTEGSGSFPFDPTLGNAHKIEATKESFLEHVQKGGPVMYPIFALAGAALLVALFKWLSFAFVREPSRKRIAALMESVEEGDLETAKQRASQLKGPLGRMLSIGVDHLGEPRDLIEEVMYETVLTTRMKLQRFLPFIAVSAASAPLLGLLGTVTGIISTFKLITVYGSGDVKTLSGGISEALITTEFGLIVAIPSLLLHAFLSRKAKGMVGRMESAAVTFVNRTGAFMSEPLPSVAPAPAPAAAPGAPRATSEEVRSRLEDAIQDLVVPMVKKSIDGELARAAAGPRSGE